MVIPLFVGRPKSIKALDVAMDSGKHVYCQKPLAHDIYEVRRLTDYARERKLVTQMGIQVHSDAIYKLAVELVRRGAIGPIREVHAWSNKKWGDPDPRPDRKDPVPASLNWDWWLGVGPEQGYIGRAYYHPENWRKRLAKFDATTGKFSWAVGRRAPARAWNGEMYNPYGVSVSHGTAFVADVLGMIWLWSNEGLYLGRLLHDAEPGRPWDEFAIHAEIQGPVTLFTNAASEKLCMVVNDTGAHIYEVTLPSLVSLPVSVIALTPTARVQARAWDPDERPPVPGSQLSVRLAQTNVLISWHTNAAAMTLQSSAAPTGVWVNATAPRFTNEDSVYVTVPLPSARQYYRLLRTGD